MVSEYDKLDLLIDIREISQLREVPKALTTCLCEKQIKVSFDADNRNNVSDVLYITTKWIIRSHACIIMLGSETKWRSGV
mgnify:CR=1 FL=1